MLFLIRLALARWFFHPLEGLRWGQWRDIVAAEDHRWSIRYWPKIALLELQTAWQSYFGGRVEKRFGATIASTRVEAPVFILGHYRSGTTHLHELMALDPRYASPTRFQAYQPASFLATEAWFARINDFFMLPRRVQEDEIALMNLSGMSPYLAWVFPESRADYERFSTLRRASPTEIANWKSALVWYLKALTIRYGRPILLKSPPHTGRIRTILAAFPDARFIHIRRNPFDVYVSTVRLLRDIDPVFRLRVAGRPGDSDTVLDTYAEMYRAFFEDVSSIPLGQFVEVAYEDLEVQPITELERIYQTLDLGEFEVVRPAIEKYLRSIAGYRKNRHEQVGHGIREEIITRWSESFARWGYPTT